MSRIMLVVRAGIGGEFRHVRVLGHELSRRGFEVAVCGPHDSAGLDPAIEVLPVEMVRPLRPGADLRAGAGVAAAIRRFRPDLIHAHGSKGGALARLARLASPSTPVVYTPHRFGFSQEVPGDRHRGVYRAIERALVPLTTHYVCVCRAEAADGTKIGATAKTTVVHNGIDLPPAADPDPRLVARPGPLIVALAELRLSKGIGTLVTALGEVRGRLPEARLAIAGDGPDRAPIEDEIRSLGQEGAVDLLGHVEDVEAVLAAADLYVSASWAESFPYSIIEAMAAALPIVATDVGGTAEAVVDGETGLLVPPREPEPLAAALLALASDRGRRVEMGRAGRERMLERFTSERMVAETVAVYRRLGVDGEQVEPAGPGKNGA